MQSNQSAAFIFTKMLLDSKLPTTKKVLCNILNFSSIMHIQNILQYEHNNDLLTSLEVRLDSVDLDAVDQD